MPIEPGQLLLHYRFVEKIGEGGMGVVWKAVDTTLDREVAIKLLPPTLATDPDRLARFEREAKLLATLNHPGIAAVYGLHEAPPTLLTPSTPSTSSGQASSGQASSGQAGSGQADSLRFLAMEFVPGEDLAQRIERDPLPLDDTIALARHIAEAVEAAHEAGVIHRDLKPANIVLTDHDKVKVLDFGLAKALETVASASGSQNSAHSPTITSAGTLAGVILGTAAYMAPEQAKGKTVDRRADIWAFGVVLWEMLTGAKLFQGETISDTLAAVLREEIDWSTLPANTPPALRQLLRRCLDRDPRTRLQAIGEARVALQAPAEEEPVDITQQASPGYKTRSLWPWLAVAAAALIVGFAIGTRSPWRFGPGTPTPERTARSFVLPTPQRSLDDTQAISPDGEWIAYTAGGVLWIRNLGELQPREVPDSAGAKGPFWSPDSSAVAFAAGGKLLKFSLDGGRPEELCRVSGGDFTGGTWSASRGIVFSLSRANWDGDVLRVPAKGGEPEPFILPDAELGERRLHQLNFLPDGRTLLYTAVTFSANSGEIAVERDGVRTHLGLGNAATRPTYSPTGHVLFTRQAGNELALWAVPFSADTLTTQGEPFRVAAGGKNVSVAADGTLVYGVHRPEPQQLIWVDRAGKQVGALGDPLQSTLWNPAVSPDGRQVLATADWLKIWVWDADREARTRVTSPEESASFAEWDPGGKEIAYTRLGGDEALLVRRSDGSGEARVLLEKKGMAAPSISPDGADLAFYVVDPDTGRDLWAMKIDKPDEPKLLLRTPANEAMPRISPDGEFIAYQSDTSGRWEIYVQPFPEGEGRWQVSTGGGQAPMWNPQGGELFFVSDNDMMVASFATRPEVRVGAPRLLFSGEALGTRLSVPRHIERMYAVAPDGNRFVVVKGTRMGTTDLVLAEGALAGD